jgi:ribosomal protein S18 acetylase RimI-like enzyme
MEIVPTGAGGPELDSILQDYRRRYHLSENVVLSALLDALASRRAQALVALENGRPVGAIVFSQRGAEGQLRLVHALEQAPAAEAALLEQAEERLRQGNVQRITGSLPLASTDRLAGILCQHGYEVISRSRMVLDLSGGPPLPEVDLAPGYELTPWQESRHDAAAVLIEEAHRDSADSALYPELAGLEGARRLIEGVGAGRYGRFDPAMARMAFCGEDMAGLALNVWHAGLSGQGFILDLSVTAAHRRQGLGRALVVATAQAFQQAGAAVLGLAVTLANRPAVALYEGLGFQVEQRFSVLQKDLGLP